MEERELLWLRLWRARSLRRKRNQPPASNFSISSRSPALSCRLENCDGATASPLCSTTTLRGKRFWAMRNSSIVQGSLASICLPLAMTEDSLTRKDCRIRCAYRSKSTQSLRPGAHRRRDAGRVLEITAWKDQAARPALHAARRRQTRPALDADVFRR